MTTIELLNEYLRDYFVMRQPERIFSILTDDIHCYGYTRDVVIESLAQAKSLLHAAVYWQFMDYELSILEETAVSEDSGMVCYTLSHGSVSATYRLTGCSRQTPSGRKLYLLHFSIVNPSEATHSLFLDSLLNSLNGDLATLLLDKQGHRVIPVFVSEGMGARQGLTKEEYLAQYGQNTLLSICPEDRVRVWQSMCNTLEGNEMASVTFRVLDKQGQTVWLNASHSNYGERDGLPMLRVLFTPISIQYDLQLQALNQEETGISVLDAESYELYYANDTFFRLYDHPPCDYTGKTCYNIFFGRRHPCNQCHFQNTLLGYHTPDQTISMHRKFLSCHAELRRWNEKRVLVLYVRDITQQFRLQQQAEESNRELQQLLGNISCGVSVCTIGVNRVYTIKYLSDGFCSLLDENKEQLRQHLYESPAYGVAPEDQEAMLRFLYDCSQGPCSNELTYRYQTRTGRLIWLTLHMTVVADQTGHLTSYGTYFDVTTQMQVQKQLADVVHNAPGGVCMYRRKNGGLDPIVISKQVSQLFGVTSSITAQQLRSMDYSMVHPEDLPALVQAVNANMSKPNAQTSYTYRIWNPTLGCYRWICTTGIHIPQEDGSQIFYVNYADVNERKELEQTLRQNEEILQTACDFADLWVWVHDLSLDQIYCYKKLREDLGISSEVIKHDPAAWAEHSFTPADVLRAYQNGVQALQNGSNKEEFECHLRHPNGSLHWTRIRLNRLSENSNLAVGTAQLIDNEKYLEARIELEEKQQAEGGSGLLAHFITNLTRNQPVEHVYHFDEPENRRCWNTLEEQLTQTLSCVVSPAKQSRFLAMHNTQYLLERYAQGSTEESLDYRRTFADGKIIWVRSVIHLVQEPRSGDILNYEYIYDIHQHRIYQEMVSAVVAFGFELCASLMVDSNQVTILHAQPGDGEPQLVVSEYTSLNQRYADTILEADRERYLHACSLEYISEHLKQQDHFEIVHRTLEDGVIHYKKDQCYGYSADHATCLLIRSDVTDIVLQERQKQSDLQSALDAAEAATLAKSEFLSRMSHEIRTPMNAIIGLTTIAKDNRSDCGFVHDCLDKIDMSSQYLLTLINDILEMSRIESGRTEIRHRIFRFSFLIESIRTVVEPLAQKSNIRYEFVNHTQTDSHYLGDMIRIQQVLVNLLTNAIKFTKAGGRVCFSVDIDSQSETLTWFRFGVSDTGIGMSEAFMQRMFQPFTQEDSSNTSEYGGSGLGLAISKNLTEAMGGTIRVASSLGVGSIFTVTLPLSRTDTSAAEPVPEPKLEPSVQRLDGCQVLLAEDHPLNVMVAQKLLERKGIVVTVAENGQIALDQFRTAPPYFFDAILMDVRMPVMDGLGATRAIRALDRPDAKTVPIIAMTANALEEDRQRSKEAGLNAHLAKPFEPAQLYTVLGQQIKRADP